VRVTNDADALPVYLSEQDILERWPWTYDQLTAQCRTRYSDFKADKKYHDIRKQLASKAAYAHERLLHPGNPASSRKVFFNPNILQELDKHYSRNEPQRASAAIPGRSVDSTFSQESRRAERAAADLRGRADAI
jgi:hypothetical protein